VRSLGAVLGLGAVTAGELYAALDWLGREQPFIENTLARRHLRDGALLLYDVTSTYLEGRHCELARYGYSRDHRRDRPQLVIGLLCARDGCPVAVEVFAGNTADPATLAPQITRIKQRFGLRHVVLVGDRGLITAARIEQTLRPAGLDWITALRAPQIQALATADGPLQLSLFDTRDMAEITIPDYPGERLVVCKNPLLAEERARKREALLVATESALKRVQARVEREKNPLRGAAAIGQAVGAVLGKYQVGKHFQIEIGEASFNRNETTIAPEAALDGIYVLRTSLTAEQADAATTVPAYKSLAHVERAFRSLKRADLELRPVFHWTAPRVRAHVLLWPQKLGCCALCWRGVPSLRHLPRKQGDLRGATARPHLRRQGTGFRPTCRPVQQLHRVRDGKRGSAGDLSYAADVAGGDQVGCHALDVGHLPLQQPGRDLRLHQIVSTGGAAA
jgi:Transposase DDE domain